MTSEQSITTVLLSAAAVGAIILYYFYIIAPNQLAKNEAKKGNKVFNRDPLNYLSSSDMDQEFTRIYSAISMCHTWEEINNIDVAIEAYRQRWGGSKLLSGDLEVLKRVLKCKTEKISVSKI